MLVVGVLAGLVLVRVALEPRQGEPVEVRLGDEELARVGGLLAGSAVAPESLVRALAPKRVVLVGESHWREEPITFLIELLGALHAADGRRAVLLLELPPAAQPVVERHLETGDEAAIAAWSADWLPYQRIVRWARAHPEAVRTVVAFDEDRSRIILMRALLTDTRNETMARAVREAMRAHPEDRVVAYGGRLHYMLAGRYLYDVESRRPAGARLLDAGLSREELATVWLFTGALPAGIPAWRGALPVHGAAGELPISYFEDAPIFGAAIFGEIVDHAVHLGAGTRMPR